MCNYTVIKVFVQRQVAFPCVRRKFKLSTYFLRSISKKCQDKYILILISLEIFVNLAPGLQIFCCLKVSKLLAAWLNCTKKFSFMFLQPFIWLCSPQRSSRSLRKKEIKIVFSAPNKSSTALTLLWLLRNLVCTGTQVCECAGARGCYCIYTSGNQVLYVGYTVTLTVK